MDNLVLLEESKKHPEPIIDLHYIKLAGSLYISKDPQNPTLLQKNIAKLRQLLDALCVAWEKHAEDHAKDILSDIDQLLLRENMNFSELAAFFAVLDISHSQYRKMSAEERKKVLEYAIKEFITHRHFLYRAYSYSDTSIQVQADSFAHKRSGPQASRKIKKMLADLGIPQALDESAFSPPFFIDITENEILYHKALKTFLGVATLDWSAAHENKIPDFLIVYPKHIFILEAKHMKESGGGQDKQMNELISFISQHPVGLPDKKVHFVAFLDGVYFNKLFLSNTSGGKIQEQRRKVIEALRAFPLNYFVNTHGLRRLLKGFHNSP